MTVDWVYSLMIGYCSWCVTNQIVSWKVSAQSGADRERGRCNFAINQKKCWYQYMLSLGPGQYISTTNRILCNHKNARLTQDRKKRKETQRWIDRHRKKKEEGRAPCFKHFKTTDWAPKANSRNDGAYKEQRPRFEVQSSARSLSIKTSCEWRAPYSNNWQACASLWFVHQKALQQSSDSYYTSVGCRGESMAGYNMDWFIWSQLYMLYTDQQKYSAWKTKHWSTLHGILLQLQKHTFAVFIIGA